MCASFLPVTQVICVLGQCSGLRAARCRCAVTRCRKDTGIGKFPSQAFALNQAWLAAALIAATLLAWLKLLALDGPLAKAEPKTLRYRILMGI